ncbi:MAG: hypothetical protein MRERC_6c023 [Mycoplasmataceae bacterium RC_NB112A]|nr:MAG: hypothetical protein MRERC_13c026 [Mycoplasmataceae bacterium RC_NB112A]KLL01939.1 MAG: hypothetical protein MRERC_6c023 [Mycoplasmataceae bacterium RC_NB112A]
MDNSLSFDKENNLSYTKAKQSGKVIQKYNLFTIKENFNWKNAKMK